jgi:hypothetical protein
MSARSEAVVGLVKQGYSPERAEVLLTRLMGLGYDSDRAAAMAPGIADAIARERAVERLIRIHAPEYRRLLAQERGDRPQAEVDDDEFPLPGEEPPDPPDEE